MSQQPASKKWVPIESSPDVMTEYAGKLGVDTTSLSFQDVLGLDPELLALVPQPVHAVIMCFPITNETEAAAQAEDEEQAAQQPAGPQAAGLWFTKQTISNACGSIAIIHAVANDPEAHPAEGSFLQRFFAATQGMTPEERAKFMECPPAGAPDLEEAHQAAAAGGESAAPSEEDEVLLHFVTFMHKDGKLWQLDGRRRGPVCHGATTPGSLLQDTAEVVKQFVERSKSISFNLVALAPA